MSEETKPETKPHVWKLHGPPNPANPKETVAIPFNDPRPDPENPGEKMGLFNKYDCENCRATARKYGDDREKTCPGCGHEHDRMYAKCQKCKKTMPPRFRRDERWKDLESCPGDKPQPKPMKPGPHRIDA